jgi:hypothetical protein
MLPAHLLAGRNCIEWYVEKSTYATGQIIMPAFVEVIS